MVRNKYASLAMLILLGSIFTVVAIVQAVPLDRQADGLIGQPNFSSADSNNGGVSAVSLNHPYAVEVDTFGNLYIVDSGNHRILVYLNPLHTDYIADHVFGQPDFTSNGITNRSATSLLYPSDIALDTDGNLYVADYENSRVLVYIAPLTTDAVADYVFGQPDFTTAIPNNGGVSAASLGGASSVTIDNQGNLYVADSHDSEEHNNNRILVYEDPLTTDRVADHVIGQPDFTSRDPGVSASSLYHPVSIDVDKDGNLYVAEWWNHRVLEFNRPLETDFVADHVFGQPEFTSNRRNNGGVSARSLSGPIGVEVDEQGHVYVSDGDNHRVLEYLSPLITDKVADRVFGQPDFTSNIMNNNGVTAESLSRPFGILIDKDGNLYVSDNYNNRVLRYDAKREEHIFLPLIQLGP